MGCSRSGQASRTGVRGPRHAAGGPISGVSVSKSLMDAATWCGSICSSGRSFQQHLGERVQGERTGRSGVLEGGVVSCLRDPASADCKDGRDTKVSRVGGSGRTRRPPRYWLRNLVGGPGGSFRQKDPGAELGSGEHGWYVDMSGCVAWSDANWGGHLGVSPGDSALFAGGRHWPPWGRPQSELQSGTGGATQDTVTCCCSVPPRAFTRELARSQVYATESPKSPRIVPLCERCFHDSQNPPAPPQRAPCSPTVLASLPPSQDGHLGDPPGTLLPNSRSPHASAQVWV